MTQRSQIAGLAARTALIMAAIGAAAASAYLLAPTDLNRSLAETIALPGFIAALAYLHWQVAHQPPFICATCAAITLFLSIEINFLQLTDNLTMTVYFSLVVLLAAALLLQLHREHRGWLQDRPDQNQNPDN